MLEKVLYNTKFILGQDKEDKSGKREFTRVNDRPTVRSLTQLMTKMNIIRSLF